MHCGFDAEMMLFRCTIDAHLPQVAFAPPIFAVAVLLRLLQSRQKIHGLRCARQAIEPIIMAMTKVDRDFIFLSLALTESARALRAIDEVERLAGVRVQVQAGFEKREFQSVFDHIRLALQFSSNVSKIFWPHQNAAERGTRLRTLAGLPDCHALSNRRLRNHIEHMDERLDDWTAQSPRPFLSTEMILHADYPAGEKREEIINASAIVYDAKSNSVILFGDIFPLTDLRASVLDVQGKCSSALS